MARHSWKINIGRPVADPELGDLVTGIRDALRLPGLAREGASFRPVAQPAFLLVPRAVYHVARQIARNAGTPISQIPSDFETAQTLRRDMPGIHETRQGKA